MVQCQEPCLDHTAQVLHVYVLRIIGGWRYRRPVDLGQWVNIITLTMRLFMNIKIIN